MQQNKKGVYTILTTFLLIVVVTVVVLILVSVFSSIIGIQSKTHKIERQSEDLASIKDRLFYCYGNIVDIKKLSSDMICLNLKGQQGISITKQQFQDCKAGDIEFLNNRGYGMVESYDISVYEEGNLIICPAKLNIYEYAVSVPLIKSITVYPKFGVKSSSFNINISIFQQQLPVYLYVDIKSENGSIAKQYYAEMNSNNHIITTNPNDFEPGKYSITVKVTYDNVYFDVKENWAYFLVLSDDTKPIINYVKAFPKNISNSANNSVNFEASVSDYFDIINVAIEIINASNQRLVDIVTLARASQTTEDFYSTYIYKGSWGVINEDPGFYNISIEAANSLGNITSKENSDWFNIYKPDFEKYIIIYVGVNFNDDNEFSQYADAFKSLFMEKTPFNDCLNPNERVEIIKDNSLIDSNCQGAGCLRSGVIDPTCHNRITQYITSKYGDNFDKIVALMNSNQGDPLGGGQVLGCVMAYGAIVNTHVKPNNQDGEGNLHEFGHQTGLCDESYGNNPCSTSPTRCCGIDNYPCPNCPSNTCIMYAATLTTNSVFDPNYDYKHLKNYFKDYLGGC